MRGMGRGLSIGVMTVLFGVGLSAGCSEHLPGSVSDPSPSATSAVDGGMDSARSARHPVADTTGIVDGRCAATRPPLLPGGASDRSASPQPLVPMIASTMVICSYDGRGMARATRIVTEVDQVGPWRDQFNALPVGPGAAWACPPGAQMPVRIAFVASRQSFTVLDLDLVCDGSVRDGVQTRSITDQLRKDLRKLLGL